MFEARVCRWMARAVIVLCATATLYPQNSEQQSSLRKVKTSVSPHYPELARRMTIGGVVKIEALVAADGKVKTTKVIGGHPLLIQAALDAVRRWRYEPAPAESTELVEVRFRPDIGVEEHASASMAAH